MKIFLPLLLLTMAAGVVRSPKDVQTAKTMMVKPALVTDQIRLQEAAKTVFPVPPSPQGAAFTVRAVVRPPPNTNRPPYVPKIGSAVYFMPLSTNVPIQYTGYWTANIKAPVVWTAWTNVILPGGVPHEFWFQALDSGSQRYYKIGWTGL